MSLATSNRDGGRTSESGHLRALLKGLKAQVLTGLAVSQRGAGANMSVDVAIGDAMIPRSDGTYGHPAWNDAVYNVAITTADVSNPRRDIVVMYIDYSVTPSTGVSNNTNGVVKIAVIAGTPAGSPSDPSNAAIQSAVGASNPYIKLARVRVAAGASSITNSVIDDLRLMAQGILQGGWTYDDLYTWTYVSATSFAIAGVDATSQFPAGTKIALYQSGSIKYFVVVSTVFSTNTTVTVTGLGTTTLANVPIDRPAFSYLASPVGFPAGNGFIPYKFSAYRVAAATVNGSQLLVMDAEDFDTGSNFSTSTGLFTAPVAGFYWFYGQITNTGNPAYTWVDIIKNGSSYRRGNRLSASMGNGVQPSVGILIKLAAGDTVGLGITNGSSSALEVGDRLKCYFDGEFRSHI